MSSTRTTLVTGAPGGIGRAICHAIVDRDLAAGVKPVIVATASKPGPRLDSLQAELAAKGATVHTVAADLADAAAVEAMVNEALAKAGDLDALVSNAGNSSAGKLTELPVDAWDRTFALNTRATWLLAKAAYPALARRRGNIVAVASMSGMYPHPGYGAYSPAKAALIMLCRQLAQEWAPAGIRVNSVAPGMIHTPLTDAVYQDAEVRARREALVPLERIGQGDDIARAVAFLSSEQASYITGENLRVDGGLCDRLLSLIPGRTAGAPPKS